MIRVGIVGASFARDAYLPAFRQIPGTDVVALASGRLESARKAAEPHGINAVYDDWREMLDAHEVDLVCIATPTDLHAPITLAALDRGAHVLCEKPTAMDAGEARMMLDRARQAGRVGMIDHELRFNPNRARIAAMIAEDDLGEIRHVNIANIGPSWNDPASRPKGDWWSDAARGGGRLGANGSHQVDLLRWWLGEPAWVTGQALTMVPERRDRETGESWTATADDLAHLMLEWPAGTLAQVFLSGVAATNAGNLTQVFGSKGTLTLANEDERLWFARAGEKAPTEITEPNPNASLEGLNKGIWNVGVFGLLKELTAAIAEGREPRRGATFVDGLSNQIVLDAVRESTESRASVRVDLSAAG